MLTVAELAAATAAMDDAADEVEAAPVVPIAPPPELVDPELVPCLAKLRELTAKARALGERYLAPDERVLRFVPAMIQRCAAGATEARDALELANERAKAAGVDNAEDRKVFKAAVIELKAAYTTLRDAAEKLMKP
jgi:hypothetical protein